MLPRAQGLGSTSVGPSASAASAAGPRPLPPRGGGMKGGGAGGGPRERGGAQAHAAVGERRAVLDRENAAASDGLGIVDANGHGGVHEARGGVERMGGCAG